MFSSSVSLVNFDGITKVFTILLPFFCDDFGVSNLLFDGVFRGVTDGVFRSVIDGDFHGVVDGVFHGEDSVSCFNWRFCSNKTFLFFFSLAYEAKEILAVFSSSSFLKSLTERKLFIMLTSTFVSCIESVLASYRLLASYIDRLILFGLCMLL